MKEKADLSLCTCTAIEVMTAIGVTGYLLLPWPANSGLDFQCSFCKINRISFYQWITMTRKVQRKSTKT